MICVEIHLPESDWGHCSGLRLLVEARFVLEGAMARAAVPVVVGQIQHRNW